MSFNRVHQLLEWPEAKKVFKPSGLGARVNVRMAEAKIGQALRRLPDGDGAKVGVLTADSNSTATEAPVAIVCEFRRRVSVETLNTAHSLAWNFCRAPLLVTIEPHALRAWSCYEAPADPRKLQYDNEAEIRDARIDLGEDPSLSEQAARSLHWVQLVSGQFFRERSERFKPENRVDQLLLSNLKDLRTELHEMDLTYDVIHDLLARLIFIQFLFQRKDKAGDPALTDRFLKKLCQNGTLNAEYKDLGGILSNYDDSYRFFRYLNNRFNGDLFPGKGATEKEREEEWQAEMKQVKPQHLKSLAAFVGGQMDMKKGQGWLWTQYSFDAIPLEFISSIYEVFVNKDEKGVHYTRGHLVDFMLDGALPWDSKDWNKRVLDPACGSGIFLVKAFYRLVQRWKNAHPRKTPTAPFLRSILENNLFGVDINPHAVRVASFSLYLALLDEIDPRWYWQKVKFPRLRDRQVVKSDFFLDDEPLFKTQQKQVQYHLIIGNAPWGKDSIKKSRAAQQYARVNGWQTAYNDIGPLFLTKGAALATPDGSVVMIQPAGLLFNIGPAAKFRRRLFSEFKVEEVVNLAALRFELFPTAISPACVVTMRPFPPDGEAFTYVCPKRSFSSGDDFRIVVEPHDESLVHPGEVTSDTLVWSALMWGGRRDLGLINKLRRCDTLGKLAQRHIVMKRQGTIRGDKKKQRAELIDRPIVDAETFPEGTFLWLDVNKLTKNKDPYTHSKDSTALEPFDPPQLIVKQSWQIEAARFQAALNTSSEGVLCSKSYISIHADRTRQDLLEASCLSYNSNLAVYNLLLSSGRFATYRPEPTVGDVLGVPIPQPRPRLLEDILDFRDLDQRTYEAFDLKESERILVDDLINFTLPDKNGDGSSPGRQRTHRDKTNGAEMVEEQEPELVDYCDTFVRVLEAGFGNSEICATVYQDQEGAPLPLRLVAVHLDWPLRPRIRIEKIQSDSLSHMLKELNTRSLQNTDRGGSISQRVATIFDFVRWQRRSIPTFYFIKPDQIRYWLRSAALRDADMAALDMMKWSKSEDEIVRKRA